MFYGAMVCEGVIALIWAAAGCSLYEVTGGLNTGLAEALAMGQSKAIYDVCSKTMGGVGIALAMIGVVVCPITSGDTAFRSARLTLADWFKIDQDSYANRLKLCIPVLGVGAFLGIGNALGFINYTVIWRYFSWTNQTLAMIVLWAASMYLFKEKKNYWITAVPATFMSAVSSTYFILAPECLGGLLNSQDRRRRNHLQHRRCIPHRRHLCHCNAGQSSSTQRRRQPRRHDTIYTKIYTNDLLNKAPSAEMARRRVPCILRRFRQRNHDLRRKLKTIEQLAQKQARKFGSSGFDRFRERSLPGN